MDGSLFMCTITIVQGAITLNLFIIRLHSRNRFFFTQESTSNSHAVILNITGCIWMYLLSLPSNITRLVFEIVEWLRIK